MTKLISLYILGVLFVVVLPGVVSAQPKPTKPIDQAVLLGQFGAWKAYKATPDGETVCFAFSEPTKTLTEPAGRKRDFSYAFISTRPAKKLKNEMSVTVGYQQKTDLEATATIGTMNFALLTHNDNAWIKNLAEQPQMIAAMRKESELIIKSESSRGTKTTDTYSLKGLAQALDKVDEECQ